MAGSRFPSLGGLYEAFPSAVGDIGLSARDADCIGLLGTLARDEAWMAGLSLGAYVLSRRDAVGWGCACIRDLVGDGDDHDPADRALAAAEAWAARPDDTLRRTALDLGLSGDAGRPETWMALAAGWSGGSIGPPEFPHLRAPPEQTARAVRTGLFLMLSRRQDAPALARCIARAAELASA